MLLHFTLDEYGFRCEDAPLISNASTIDYIKCHFDFREDTWKSVDAIVAVFKSATYNTVAEVLLDSNNDCFIEPEVYKRGGNIQVKLIGDKYINDSVHSTTHISAIAEFYIKENVIIPTATPSKYDVFVAELEIAQQAVNDAIADIYQKAVDGEFDGDDGVGIVSVSYNADGTVNVTLTDGTTFTSAYSMKGAKGDTGDAGVGISNVLYGQDGTLTITMSNGTIYTSEYSMKGLKGDKGDTGDTGQDGQDGADGFSPIATTSKVGDTATITITDKNGTTTATISDGADGTDGVDGQDGADGFSPTATVSKSGDTATISITDKNGTTTATVSDGADGTDGTDGQDGYSPSATVTKSGTVATITITDKDGTTTAEVYDGSGSVSDVEVDGTSVVTGGVAEIDLTGKSDVGHTHIKSAITDFPTTVSSFTNDAGYITGVTSTDTPTADTIAEFDASAHMNSTDMTAAEVTTFINSIDIGGSGSYITSETWTFTLSDNSTVTKSVVVLA